MRSSPAWHGVGQARARARGADDDCFWLYSSGSTGRPKGAVHAQRDMVVTSELYGVRVLGVTESDICYSAAKLFFAYGLGNGMTFPLWVGGTAILDDRRPTPDTTFEIIERFTPTLYYGVPTLYAAQLAALERSRAIAPLRSCVSAGEALPTALFGRWRDATTRLILDGIGRPRHSTSSSPTGARIAPGISGRPVPGYEARIVDDARRRVVEGRARSRCRFAGDSTATYYWNKPEKTPRHHGRWLALTGDTYRQDDEGYLRLRRSLRRHAEGGRHLVPRLSRSRTA